MKILKSNIKSFRSSVKYNIDKELDKDDKGNPVAERIAGSMIWTSSDIVSRTFENDEKVDTNWGGSDVVSRTFEADASVNTNVVNKGVHLKISLHPDDVVSNSEFKECVKYTLDKLGFENCSFAAWRHHDEPHPHVHVIASRVNVFGSVVSDSFDGIKMRIISRELEEKFGWKKAGEQNLSEDKSERLQSYYERKKFENTNLQSGKEYIKTNVRKAGENRPSLRVFCQRLERQNIRVAARKYYLEKDVNRSYPKIGLSYFLMKDPVYKRENRSIPKDYSYIPGEVKSQILGGKISGLFPFKFPDNSVKNVRAGFNQFNEFQLFGEKDPTEFVDLKVRASRLGPAFTWDSVKDNLSSVEEDVLQQITVTEGRGKAENIDYSKSFVLDEAPEITRLVHSIKTNNEEGIYEDVALAGGIENIPSKIVEAIPEEYYNKLIGEEFELAPSGGLSITKLISDYNNTYRRQPNEQTILLFRAIADSSPGDIFKTVQEDFLYDVIERADPRTIDLNQLTFLNNMERNILYDRQLELDNDKDEHPMLMTENEWLVWDSHQVVLDALRLGKMDIIEDELKKGLVDLDVVENDLKEESVGIDIKQAATSIIATIRNSFRT